ncbi:MAG: glucuronate isomerase [Spirochaetaceae bacterium]|jgi:glucuronate isomerase|nr:glucuronate isomerase [Spirochaetaceae bacterium]
MTKNSKPFMDRNFLLETETARDLYHHGAKGEPIYDYHCHLIPSQIAENKRFANLTELWLSGDHYKWRMMRALGIDEAAITGDAPAYDKFRAWARTVENLIGNPLYHWTHLELQRYFDIYETLTEKSAPGIWAEANGRLEEPELSVKGIFEKFKVYAVGTTDDPADSLEYHRAIAGGIAPIGPIATRVIPSFRPDKALHIDLPGFAAYIEKLGAAGGAEIRSFSDLLAVLEKRLDFFVAQGCRASDHGMEAAPFVIAPEGEIEKTFENALAGKPPSREAADAYKTKLLSTLARWYARRGLVMQLHLSVIRNSNERMFKLIGPDMGYDAVHDREQAGNLAALLSLIESSGPEGLPKTVLYSLNPKDSYPLATIMGCFQDCYGKEENREVIRGKIQLGSAWWFCDHLDGMEAQIRTLANVGVLPAFIGMLTDSRSLLSYPRHEYFRRLLCNIIGNWVEQGHYPPDRDKLLEIVRNISFGNARAYFGSI